MIYNNPIAYRVDVTPEVLRTLADVPRIVYVKEETGDICRITDMSIALGSRFGIFFDADDLIVESIALGAAGLVSGMTNAWPRECVELFTLCVEWRLEAARELCRILTPSLRLDTHVKLVRYINFVEHLVYGSPERTRAPRLPLIDNEREHVTKTVLEAAVAPRAREKRRARSGS